MGRVASAVGGRRGKGVEEMGRLAGVGVCLQLRSARCVGALAVVWLAFLSGVRFEGYSKPQAHSSSLHSSPGNAPLFCSSRGYSC